ncbi:MAG: Spy/CpxP family protein refolding chaperone [Hyphomicrobiaceae bacterium]|nr:Spy/CpxP family protein refolding chaperone [Hyphomicrobiaceae bacterium]
MKPSVLLPSLLALSLIMGAATQVTAQQRGPGWGMMGGQGMMGGFGWGMPMGRGMGMGMGNCPMWGSTDTPAFAEGRVAFLKAELAITDAQSSAWDTYANALKRNLESMQGMRQTMLAASQAKSPVERLDAHITVMEGRLATLKDIKAPLEALYAALNDAQKKKADDLLTGMGCMI